MKDNTIEMPCGEYGNILFSIPKKEDEIEEVGLDEQVKKLKTSFETISSTVFTSCRSFIEVAGKLVGKAAPQKMELTFGIKVEAGAAIITHASTEAHFSVKFEWEFPKQEAQGEKTTKTTP